jgi:hypothetical protein
MIRQVLDRDSFNCVIIGLPLDYSQGYVESRRHLCELDFMRFCPALAWLISVAITKNVCCFISVTYSLLTVVFQAAALECIASLAGEKTLNAVLERIGTIDNAVVIGAVARAHFDHLLWAQHPSL